MKKLYIFLLVAVLALAGIGTTLALMSRSTNIKNTFDSPKIMCEVSETFEDNVKSNICIVNTGEYVSYVRVKLISYWVYEDGTVAPIASVMPEIELLSDWIESDGIYYYTKSIEPEASTTALCKPITLVTKSDDSGNTVVYQVVEIISEAIQANPHSAVKEAWRVDVNDAGIITAPIVDNTPDAPDAPEEP